MVAPGDSLEIQDLPEFARRVSLEPKLRQEIVDAIKNRPNDAQLD